MGQLLIWEVRENCCIHEMTAFYLWQCDCSACTTLASEFSLARRTVLAHGWIEISFRTLSTQSRLTWVSWACCSISPNLFIDCCNTILCCVFYCNWHKYFIWCYYSFLNSCCLPLLDMFLRECKKMRFIKLGTDLKFMQTGAVNVSFYKTAL